MTHTAYKLQPHPLAELTLIVTDPNLPQDDLALLKLRFFTKHLSPDMFKQLRENTHPESTKSILARELHASDYEDFRSFVDKLLFEKLDLLLAKKYSVFEHLI